MEIYLDEYTCSKMGLSYRAGHESATKDPEVQLHVGDLLYWRKCWDLRHRAVFAEYVEMGSRINVVPTEGPGWYEIIDYPPKRVSKAIDTVDDERRVVL